MASQIEGAVLTETASAAIGLYRRVTRNGSQKLIAAGAEADDIGTLEKEAFNADEVVPVRSRNAEGTVKMIADGAISYDALVYPAASGKISGTPNGKPIGRCLNNPGGDGEVAEVLRFVGHGTHAMYEAVTDDKTLTAEESGKTITNDGASGAVVVTLPQSAGQGVQFTFVCLAAQNLQVDPGAAGAIWASNGTTYAKQTDDKYVQGGAVGERLTVVSNGDGDWVATEQSDGNGASGFDTIES